MARGNSRPILLLTWCKGRGIRGIAILDRFFRTLKEACRRQALIPLQRGTMRRDIEVFVSWYNCHRPHTSLDVRTPNEVYHGLEADSQRPRVEPRAHWPARSPCASPQVPVNTQARRVHLTIDYLHRRRDLLIVTIKYPA